MPESDMLNNESSTDLLICQFCNKETPSVYNFCTQCHKQVKCVNCGSKTVSTADFCLMCGESLVVRNSSTKSPNRYTREVKKEGDNYSENTNFELTDAAVREIAPFIIGQVMPDKIVPASKQIAGSEQETEAEYEEVMADSDERTTQVNNDLRDNRTQKPDEVKSRSSSMINNFFKVDNNELVAIENDFKGATWADQQRNFIIFFASAYQEIFNKPLPDKEVVKEAAKKLKIADSKNFSRYLNKIVDDYMTTLSNGIELNTKGKKEAEKLLQIMLDENKPAGYAYISRSSTTTTQRRQRFSKDEKSEVNSWLNDNIDLGRLDIRDVKTGRDAALLAFWALTVHLKKAKALSISSAIYYLQKRFTTVSVSSEAFSSAVTRNKDAEKYFQKNNEGLYFLSTTGEKIVEDWISGATSIKQSETNS